ncbi:signal peptidase II [Candidatus Thiosymbion oneisti]|uniref:signal peptidase II n=1 Tax=Candidatus Thiosymbion oneisti TaxID=589554 RepID=UPI00105DFC84|nr:signal peptidase II [Candidatus Thiosymbion oneisti]
MARWLWLSVLVVVLDQATKWLAAAMLDPYRPLPLVPLLNLTLMYNEGAAFSFLASAGGWQRWFFACFAILMSVVLVIWLLRLGPRERLMAAALSLIVGGAVGNLIDRVLTGRVVDFIDLYVGDWHWPAFNVADSAITLGVILLLLGNLRAGKAR